MGSTIPVQIVDGPDGCCYALNSFGSSVSDGLSFDVDGQVAHDALDNVILGAPYDGTSCASNLLISTIDKLSGDILWHVYTNNCDVRSSYSCAAVSPDGGLVVYTTSSATSDPSSAVYFSLVDVNGSVTELSWDVPDGNSKRVCHGAISKISPDGVLKWCRPVLYGSIFNGSSVTISAYIKCISVGSNGNIFLGGNFRSSLRFPQADGQSIAIYASDDSLDGWDGTEQTSAGESVVAVLDSAGFYVKHLHSSDRVAYDYADRMAFCNGNLFVLGHKLGPDDSDLCRVYCDCYDADLTPVFHTLFNSSTTEATISSKLNAQNESLQVFDGKVLIAGAVTGILSSPTDESVRLECKSKFLQGYVAVLDASSGLVSAIGQNDFYITKFYGAYPCSDGSFWVLGYGSPVADANLSSQYNFYHFDSNLVKSGIVKPVATGGTLMMASQPLVCDSLFIVNVRCGQSRKSVPLCLFDSQNSESALQTAAPTNWASTVACFSMRAPDACRSVLAYDWRHSQTFSLSGFRLFSPDRTGLFVVDGKLKFCR